MEDLKGKGGGRLKHRTIDGDVPLCLSDDSSSKGKKREENESGISTLNKMKHRDMNNMAIGSKDLFVDSTGNKMIQKTKKLHSLYCKKYEVNALK